MLLRGAGYWKLRMRLMAKEEETGGGLTSEHKHSSIKKAGMW